MPRHLALKSKRIAIALAISLGVAGPATVALAGGDSPSSGSVASAPAGSISSGGTKEPAKANTAVSSSAEMENELQQLRDLLEAQAKQAQQQNEQLKQQIQEQNDQLREQQQKVETLEEQLAAANAAGGLSAPGIVNAAIGPTVGAPSNAPSPQGQDVGKRIDSLEDRLKNFGPFSFSGDFRLRDEPYFGGPIAPSGTNNQSQVRDRERYRARFYINAKLNDDISGGLALASGDINDPISTNQTANQFFTRKPFYLDKAFIDYTPHQIKALTLIGGKFAYPWYNTELTWDKDISPEGVAQKLEWKSDDWRVLKQFALVGFELPFAETQQTTADTTFNATGLNAIFPYPNNSIHQSIVYGGQIQTRWQLASWLSFTADSAFYNWHNADPIALATQQADAASPGLGTLKLGTSASNLTNTYQIVTESFTVPVSPTTGTCTVGSAGTCKTTTVSSAIIAAKLDSKFALSDTIAQFDIKTPSAAWPIRFLADYVQNTEACGNDPGAAPLTTAEETAISAIATFTTSVKNPSTGVISAATGTAAADPHAVNGCDPRYRRANWLEARFGRQQEKGDWQFAYTHMLIEREAVMSVFNFSDIRQGSAVAQNRVEAFYQAYRNVQLGFTGFFGIPIGAHPPTTGPAAQDVLKRLQFDVVYKF